MTMQQHRTILKEICATQLRHSIETEFYNESVNSKLQDYYSDGDESVLFRTFEEWVNLGYRIKKGEKAFCFWGTPEDFEIRNEKDPSKIESIGSFYPVVFKFSEIQVYKPEYLR